MNAHLGSNASASTEARPANRRNGRSKKTASGDLGDFVIDTPRNRARTFEPQVIRKHQRRLAGFDEKILALNSQGITTRDIQEVVNE
jgi:putative transposase